MTIKDMQRKQSGVIAECRGALLQLNRNLLYAFDQAVRCLFYLNGRYYPAEDRALYFSLDIENRPDNLAALYDRILYPEENTIEDYDRREEAFRTRLLDFILNQT